ncbi:retrotransposable element Tf2 [Tanacetum coccineum]
MVITRSTSIQEPSNQTPPPETQNLTELCRLLRQINDKVDGLCIFKDSATAEFARINASEGTSGQGGNNGNLMLHVPNNNAQTDPQIPIGRVDIDWIFPKEDQKMRLVSMHLFDKALNWHLQFVKRFRENVPWNVYEAEILSRFGEVFDDPLVELKNLKQTTDVQSYQDKFEMLLNKVDLSEAQAVNGMEATVALTKPRPQYASNSSYKYQQSNMGTKTTTYPPTPPLLALLSAPKVGYANPIRKQLTQKELEEKRAKNQCFYCDQRYVPGHKCSGQLYSLEVVANMAESDDSMLDLSANVIEVIGKKRIFWECSQTIEIILNQWLLQKVGMSIKKNCSFRNVYAMVIRCCDMVLGVQWLATLGDILWKFEKLTMEYKYKGKRVVLRGSQQAALSWLNGKQSIKGMPTNTAELSLMSQRETAFKTLKEAMISTPVPSLPNFNKEFVMETDACDVGIGAVLVQADHPIAYMNSWVQDVEMQALITKLQADPNSTPKFTWVDGQLRRKGRLVVGNDALLKQQIITYFHKGPLGGHSGVHVTAKKLADVFFWKGLRKMVKAFVKGCDVCQRYKPDLSAYPGLIQPLPIPTHVWSEISMDFIESLPKSQGKSVLAGGMWIDIEQIYAHFMPLQHPFTASDVAKLFLNNIYKLHGLPKVIVSDRDKVFISHFWQSLFKVLKVQLHLSTAYHPQTDGQTEVVNRSLGCYLSLCSGRHPPVHLPYVPGDSMVEAVDRSLQAREQVIQMLQFHLKRAQDRMASFSEAKGMKGEFQTSRCEGAKLMRLFVIGCCSILGEEECPCLEQNKTLS